VPGRVVADDLAAADDAWRGIDVAFAHQHGDGGFEAEIRPNGASAKKGGAAVDETIIEQSSKAVNRIIIAAISGTSLAAQVSKQRQRFRGGPP
jgi:hypothetical protein